MTMMLLEWVLTASFLILAVFGLRAAFGRRVSARLRYALWLVVLVRLLVPVQLFTSPIAGMWMVTEKRVEHSVAQPSAPPASLQPPVVSVGTGQNVPVSGNQGSGNVLTPPALPEMPDPPQAPEAPEAPDLRNPPSWLALLGWAWLAGSGVIALGLAWANLGFARRLRRVRLPLAADCPLPVYAAVGLPSPCLFGILRPAVYVTPECAADPAMLRHVIAHEYTHFRQGDHIWSVLRCAALAAHWWNPLAWLAVGLSRRDGELACDEGALKRLGNGERLAYGNTLLTLVTAKPGPVDLLRCATTMAGDKNSLKERFTRIAKAPKQLLWAAVAVVLVTALACAVAFGKAEDAPDGRDPVELPPADLTFTLETAGDGKPFVRIGGRADGQTVDHTVWYPEGNSVLFGDLAPGEAKGPELSTGYEFSTGWAGMSARWADEERTSVTVSTVMSATLSSYFNSGYWAFTVELSGDSGEVVFKEHSEGSSGTGELKLYPEALPGGEAVQAARYAAKLLTAAEDYYNNAAAGRGAELTFDWDGSPAMLVNGTNLSIGTDLNRNGVPETITVGRLCSPEEADEARACEDDSRWRLGLVVVVKEGDEVLWYGFAGNIHAGENAILLYTKDGQHYLMEFDIHGGQGHGSGDYRLFTLENGGEHTVRENHVEFDYCWTGAGADVRENFDPEAVAAFVEEADGLLADCVVLADTAGDFWPDQPLRVDLRWLSNYAFGFQWDTQLTTLENLTRFKRAGEAPAYTGDLDRDGIRELIQRTVITGEEGGAQGQRVELWRDGEMIWSDEAYYSHAGYNALFLCTLDGKDYLLRYNPYMQQGWCDYSYQLFTLSGGGEEQAVREDSLAFNIDIGSPLYDGSFDPEKIAAFVDEVNTLLANSVQLINTDADLLATFQDAGRLVDDLSWLDTWEPVFTRDPSKSLLENLRAFKEAMSAQDPTAIRLLTLNEYGNRLQLTYGGRHVQFDGYWDEMHQPEVDFQVRDFNGDGKDEIAFALLEGHGTGLSVNQLYLFDADTLEQYDTADLTERVIAQIQSTGDDQYFYLSAPGMERVSVPKSIAYDPVEQIGFGDIVYYYIQDGRLSCVLSCAVGNIGPEYNGSVRAALTMDRQGKVNPVSYEYVPEEIPADSPAAQANALYSEVLLGTKSFTLLEDGGGERQMDVSGIPGLFPNGNDGYTAVRRFATVDLDGRDLPEVVLKVDAAGDAGGYLVLFQRDGGVYGLKMGYRIFWELKRDGTFTYSDPTGLESGVAYMYLGTGETGRLVKKLRFVLDPDADQYTYYVGWKEAAREEYEAEEAEWEKRPDAIWYAFTPENIRNIFG